MESSEHFLEGVAGVAVASLSEQQNNDILDFDEPLEGGDLDTDAELGEGEREGGETPIIKPNTPPEDTQREEGGEAEVQKMSLSSEEGEEGEEEVTAFIPDEDSDSYTEIAEEGEDVISHTSVEHHLGQSEALREGKSKATTPSTHPESEEPPEDVAEEVMAFDLDSVGEVEKSKATTPSIHPESELQNPPDDVAEEEVMAFDLDSVGEVPPSPSSPSPPSPKETDPKRSERSVTPESSHPINELSPMDEVVISSEAELADVVTPSLPVVAEVEVEVGVEVEADITVVLSAVPASTSTSSPSKASATSCTPTFPEVDDTIADPFPIVHLDMKLMHDGEVSEIPEEIDAVSDLLARDGEGEGDENHTGHDADAIYTDSDYSEEEAEAVVGCPELTSSERTQSPTPSGPFSPENEVDIVEQIATPLVDLPSPPKEKRGASTQPQRRYLRSILQSHPETWEGSKSVALRREVVLERRAREQKLRQRKQEEEEVRIAKAQKANRNQRRRQKRLARLRQERQQSLLTKLNTYGYYPPAAPCPTAAPLQGLVEQHSVTHRPRPPPSHMTVVPSEEGAKPFIPNLYRRTKRTHTASPGWH